VHRPAGIAALSGFFWFGTLMSGTTAAALAFPGGGLDRMWRLNPQAHEAFLTMGPWAIALMVCVSLACTASAIGLWIGAQWGQRAAVAVLAVNLFGDTANALLREDWRTLIGLPIAGGLIAYLLSARVRTYFKSKTLVMPSDVRRRGAK